MPHLSIDMLTFGVLFTTVITLMLLDRLPSVQGFHSFLNSLNSRGGNIMLLFGAGMYFFARSMRVFYYLFEATRQGFIAQDNAFALMGLQFATSTAFGGAFGALLKTMTGETDSQRRNTDQAPTTPEKRHIPNTDAPKVTDVEAPKVTPTSPETPKETV